jgi:hypothetical protein
MSCEQLQSVILTPCAKAKQNGPSLPGKDVATHEYARAAIKSIDVYLGPGKLGPPRYIQLVV